MQRMSVDGKVICAKCHQSNLRSTHDDPNYVCGQRTHLQHTVPRETLHVRHQLVCSQPRRRLIGIIRCKPRAVDGSGCSPHDVVVSVTPTTIACSPGTRSGSTAGESGVLHQTVHAVGRVPLPLQQPTAQKSLSDGRGSCKGRGRGGSGCMCVCGCVCVGG